MTTTSSPISSIANLTAEEKRALLGQLLRRQDVVSPLSHGQQALWFLSQLTPESAAYNSNIPMHVRAKLDGARVRRVLQALVERHAVLRTTFATVGGDPIQQVRAAPELNFRQEDVSAWSEEALQARVDEEAQRPFDLECDPVLRGILFTRAADDHVLLLTVHHIIVDFLSLALLFDDFVALLLADLNGEQAVLPPGAAPYTDYVRWQAEMLNGPQGARQWAYWERQLAGDIPRLDLADKPRPSIQKDHGAVHAFKLDEPLTRGLRALAQGEGATLYVVLLAAFQVLLHRYTAEKDVVVGSFALGRTRPEFGRTLGYFVNPIALRTNMDGDPTFAALLASVRRMVLDTLEHQDYPFPLLVERLGVAQDNSSAPVFQVAFNMLKQMPSGQGVSLSMLNPDVARMRSEAPRLERDGLTIEPFPLRKCAVQFDLEFTLDDAGDSINAFLAYNVDLFSVAAIQQLADHFLTLLAGIVAHPARRIGQIPLLTEAERDRVLSAWNDTAAAYPADACLHHLFEQQALRTPDNVAVVYGDERLTYAELDAQANRLAHHLRFLGVGPEVVVGVCLDRSVDLVVSLLGVLKAGGAYLPLETDAPRARIQQLLRNAGAVVCLTQERLHTRLQGDAADAAKVVCVDRQALGRYPATAPALRLAPDNLVSIYYTSGSTGQPKGVANTHRGWVNRMVWMQQRYALRDHDTVLQKTTLTFDDAAVEFFWPLSVGARIALLEPGLHKDPRAILAAAIRYQVAVLQFVPSMMGIFLEGVTPRERDALGCLRHVISSGEALRPSLVRLFAERVGCGLHNQWGPTEVSIDATAHTCHAADGAVGATVPIGRPIANTRVYILDAWQSPVPVGVTGDLYVAGVGVARGYLNDTERTAEAFVPNPFEPGTVMYKTGDRGRFRPDGSIAFLGRLDDQVKVRGQRVELAEIEAVLARHSAVKDCAVVALKGSDEYRLVAYTVLHPPIAEEQGAQGEQADVSRSVRSFLKERLPEYMVPGRFMLLEDLPVTASGKIDRTRLPAPTDDRPMLDQTYAPPRTPAEVTIASIWRHVLKLSQVGVNDQFFELGGHSLDATRVVSRIKQELGVNIPLREFFEAPMVAALARWVDRALVGGDTHADHGIPSVPRRETYELSHAQERYWFQYQFDRTNAYGALLALDMNGPLDTDALTRALGGFAMRHGITRTTFTERDGAPCQIVHDAMLLPFQYDDLSTLEATRRAEVLTQAVVDEVQTPFDLTTGPLLRTRLYKLAEHTYRLLLALHPVTFDGWSVTVFIDDLGALYRACKNGASEAALPPVAQYVDYAAWHNQRLAAGDFDAQRAYWLKQLDGLHALPELPRDFAVPPPRPDAMTSRFMTIDAALTASLHELARGYGATLYMTLLAALSMWIARVSGETDVVVGSPLSGRTRMELEGIFGVLWNPVALRTDLAGNPSFPQVLERARATALGAYANQEYPFDLVVQDLRQRHGTDAADAGLYSVVLVVQNASTIVSTFDDVDVRLSRSDFLLEGRNPIAEKLADDVGAEYDLHIEVFDVGAELRTVTQYNPRRFRAETVDRFMNQFVSVLRQIVADPQVRLSQMEPCAAPDLDDLFGDDAGLA